MPEPTRWLGALLLVIVANVTPWAAGRFLSGHGPAVMRWCWVSFIGMGIWTLITDKF